MTLNEDEFKNIITHAKEKENKLFDSEEITLNILSFIFTSVAIILLFSLFGIVLMFFYNTFVILYTFILFIVFYRAFENEIKKLKIYIRDATFKFFDSKKQIMKK